MGARDIDDTNTWGALPEIKSMLLPLRRTLETEHCHRLVEQAQKDIEALEDRRAHKPKVKKKSRNKKWRDKPIPTREEWDRLHTVFAAAAQTGKKDDMERATRKATSFDNRHGTDFIGKLSLELGKKPRTVREGFFTKANGTKHIAQEFFEFHANYIYEAQLTASSQSPQRPSQQYRQPAA